MDTPYQLPVNATPRPNYATKSSDLFLRAGLLDFAMQPGSGVGSNAVCGPRRNVEHLGRLSLSQPGEVAELDQLARGPIDLLEFGECGIECQQILARVRCFNVQVFEIPLMEVHTHQVASVPQSLLATGTLDEDAPHCLSGCREEVASPVPVTRLAIARHQAQERLVYQRRRLQCLARLLARQIRSGELPQFVIDQRQQQLRRAGISRFDPRQNASDLCS